MWINQVTSYMISYLNIISSNKKLSTVSSLINVLVFFYVTKYTVISMTFIPFKDRIQIDHD